VWLSGPTPSASQVQRSRWENPGRDRMHFTLEGASIITLAVTSNRQDMVDIDFWFLSRGLCISQRGHYGETVARETKSRSTDQEGLSMFKRGRVAAKWAFENARI